MKNKGFENRIRSNLETMRPAEQRVARFFLGNPEDTLVGSASSIAKAIDTSDATVIRTVKALGFSGMDHMRRELIGDMQNNPAPFKRLSLTLDQMGDDVYSALDMTLEIHLQAIERLRHDIKPEIFTRTVNALATSHHIHLFGIGPSSAMADYMAIQLGRYGLPATTINHSGLLLADQLLKVDKGDTVLIFAYGRVYPELKALLKVAQQQKAKTVLISDTLGEKLGGKVDLVLPVRRGRTDRLSMHTTTLALIEALLVAVAKTRGKKTISSLKRLHALRAGIGGDDVK